MSLLILTGRPTPAQADSPSEQAGLQKYTEGKKAYDARHYEDALRAFLASIELRPSPNARLYIARCYRELQRPGKAYVEYQAAQKEAETLDLATRTARYAATKEAAKKEAAEVEPKVARLTLAVPSDSPNAMRIVVDDEEIPRAVWGAAMEVDPGKHAIQIKGGRVRPQALNIDLKPGEKKRVDLSIEKLPTSVLHVQLKIKPAGLAVEVDKVALDPKQFEERQEVNTGEHTVVVQAPGYVPFVWRKVTSDREIVEIPVDLGASRGTPKWAFYTTGAASIALLVGGAALTVAAAVTNNAEAAKDPLLRDPATRGLVRWELGIGSGLFIGGGLAAIGTGALYFLTDWKAPSLDNDTANMRFSPWIGDGIGGVVALGHF